MRMKLLSTLVLAAAMTMSGAGAATGDASLFGVWRNPKDTVHVEIRACGQSACGYAVWATRGAQDAARKGSGKALIGMQLFRNFEAGRTGEWRGEVYLPDHNLNIAGSARLVGPDTLQARGCLVRGLLCKSQAWVRVDAVQPEARRLGAPGAG
jgi:uncharacterized protein (DUF2147 family)